MILLAPEPSDEHPQRVARDWPRGVVAETLERRLRVRLPEATLVHAEAETVARAREWLSAQAPRAAISLRADRAYCGESLKDGAFALAWLRVEDLGSGVRFEWTTATETANVGFNLYAVGDGELRLLNDEIIPSAVIDSREPQRYEFEAWDVPERTFVLEDVDLLGVRRYHGPFERGEALWIAFATSSLPVPVSPWMRTGASVSDTTPMAL